MKALSIVFLVAGGHGGAVTTRDRLLAAFVAVLWGANFLAIHVGLEHWPPLLLAAVRFVLIAAPAVLLVPRPPVPLRWLLGYGIGFGTLQFLFLFIAMDAGMPPGLASLVLQASAPFTVLLGVVLLRERLGLRQGVGIGSAVPGWPRSRSPGVPRRSDGRAAAGAADPARGTGLGVRQHRQPAGHARRTAR